MIKKILIVLFFIFTGCNQLVEKTSPLDGIYYILDGWEQFEGGEYDRAHDLFSTVLLNNSSQYYTDTYVGLAWNSIYKANTAQGVSTFSEREYQMKAAGGQWIRGKGFDTSCPVGPWLVTRDEVRKVQDLDLWLNLNGKNMQKGNTSTMIFDVKTIVSYVSHYMTLEPGDLIATGTPPGVGAGMKPQKFLKHGDEMHLGIEKLGEQCQKVVKWK